MLAGSELVADADGLDSELEAPCGRPVLEHGDVAAVGVDVQVLGIQVPDPDASSCGSLPVRAGETPLGDDPLQLEHRRVGGEEDEVAT